MDLKLDNGKSFYCKNFLYFRLGLSYKTIKDFEKALKDDPIKKNDPAIKKKTYESLENIKGTISKYFLEDKYLLLKNGESEDEIEKFIKDLEKAIKESSKNTKKN